MAKKTEYVKLQEIVRETANTSISIGVNDDEWSAYFIFQKKKFTNKSFTKLCEEVNNFILSTRTVREIKNPSSKKKGANKPYTI